MLSHACVQIIQGDVEEFATNEHVEGELEDEVDTTQTRDNPVQVAFAKVQ
jgi:hypothetical protein